MSDPIIVTDPGHGSSSSLGTCQGGLIEKDVTLLLGLELEGALGVFHVRLTRRDDTNPSFTERGEMSRDTTLALVIHVNASRRATAHGLTCYFMPGDPKARDVAQAILDATPWELRTPTHPILAYDDPATTRDDWIQNPRAVMRRHRPTTVVLAEVGFSTNDSDRAFLLSSAGRSAAVTALRAGVCRAVLIG